MNAFCNSGSTVGLNMFLRRTQRENQTANLESVANGNCKRKLEHILDGFEQRSAELKVKPWNEWIRRSKPTVGVRGCQGSGARSGM